MPTTINPIDPESVRPPDREEEELARKKVEAEKVPPPQPAVPEEPRPDVTKMVRKINKRLEGQWAPNELRCGRAYVIGEEFDLEEVREIVRAFAGMKWQINVSKEPGRGVILSFKLPQPEKKPSDKRGRGGYL